MIRAKIKALWPRFWLGFAGPGHIGRMACRLAGWFCPPYKGRHSLAGFYPAGYTSPSARVHLRNFIRGKHVFIGDGVTLYARSKKEAVTLGDEVFINKDTIIELGHGGSLVIGDRTTIQPRCQLSAYSGHIKIGNDVQIAPNCAFYPYNHGMSADKPMKQQPLFSRGGIVIEDDVWLGYGVIVLDGVHIGKGAIIGAGSVVNRDIPAFSVAVGVPVKIVKNRADNHETPL